MNSQFHMALITEASIKEIPLDYKQWQRKQKQISSEL